MSVGENGINQEKGSHARNFKQGFNTRIDYTGVDITLMKCSNFIGWPGVNLAIT